MKVIKEGRKAEHTIPWKKIVTCDSFNDTTVTTCGAIFEVIKEDLVEHVFGNQDDKRDEYTYLILCPSCKNVIDFPELALYQPWRTYS